MRKKLAMAVCVAALIALTTGCGQNKDSVVYIMSDVQEGDHPTAIACDRFAELVYDRTDGRIVIEVYHGDTLGNETEQLEQVAAGGIDFARVSGPLSSYAEDMKAFQSLYLYESEDAMWKVLKGPVGDALLADEGFTGNNILGLAWFSGGSRNFYNNKKVVTSPEDLAGLTLRVNTDHMIQFLNNVGANPVNIAYNDIYNSINSGIIDGAENNWPSYISTGHYEVAPYITIDQHTSIPEMLVVSKSALESMSREDQEIVKECAKEISDYQIQAMTDYESKAMKIAEEAGCTITVLTPEQSAAFMEEGAKVNEVVSADLIDVINRLTK